LFKQHCLRRVANSRHIPAGEPASRRERRAIIYTMIETCRRQGLNPYQYLRDVLSRLPNMTNHQIPEVIPAAWAKTQRKPQLQAAS
jgi:hypothetical protein